jgi:diapolycopene oxygenase
MHSSDTIGVIGSGLGGLSAACVLAARGYRVTVFEKNAWIGGKAAVLRAGGYRFDMGPTILIYPSVLKKIFAEAGRDISDYLQLVPLEPQWRCFFDDGTRLNLYGNQDRMRAELNSFAPALPTHSIVFIRRPHSCMKFRIASSSGGRSEACATRFRLALLQVCNCCRM